jgi:hypothetical protein
MASTEVKMVRWNKRLRLSFLSVLIASGTLGVCAYIIRSVLLAGQDFRLTAVLYSMLGWELACFGGWWFAVPLVLCVRTLRRRSFPVWLTLGSAVGPLIVTMMLGVSTFFEHFPPAKIHHHAGQFAPSPFRFYFICSFLVSCSSSLIYLSLLRREQQRESQEQEAMRLPG